MNRKMIAAFVAASLLALAPAASATEARKGTAAIVPVKPTVETVRAKVAVEGIFCADCLKHIDAGLKKLKGFEKAEIDHKTGVGFVTFNPALSSRAQVLKAINDTGYKAKWL